MNSLSHSSIDPDPEEIGLRQGLRALLAGKIEHFVHVYTVETPSGPRAERCEVSPLRIGGAMHFIAVPGGLAANPGAATELNRALQEAVSNPRALEPDLVMAALAGGRGGIRIAPVEFNGRTHLFVKFDDPSEAASDERLLLAQEEERHRIAIELHDSTTQHLVALNIGLARLRRLMRGSWVERQAAEDLSRAVQDAIREIRTFSFLMNPPQLGRDGLEATARRFVAGFHARANVKASLVVAGSPDVSSPIVQHTLFRVVQEALTNIYRLAKATEVRLTLICRAGWVTLRISDNGRGEVGQSAQARAPVGVGVAGMTVPVVHLGGSLTVRHRDDGDEIVARLPIRVSRRPGASS